MQIPSARHAVNLALRQIDPDDPAAEAAKRLRKRGQHRSRQNRRSAGEGLDSPPHHRRMPYHRMKSVNWRNHLPDEEWWEEL